MPYAKCPIWGTEASVEETTGDFQVITSERAGGKFLISGTALATLGNWNTSKNAERAALSQAILEANINGDKLKIFSGDVDQRSALLRRRSVFENLQLLLKTAKWKHPKLGQSIFRHGVLKPSIPNDFLVSLAWESHTADLEFFRALMKFFEAAYRKGFVEIGESDITFSLEGIEFVERLALSSKNSESIFVAMWFGSKETSDFFEKAVKPAIEGAGYLCVRIDQTEHNERIDEQILAEIRKSRAVLVDITCGLSKPIGEWSSKSEVGAPRGGVYFEAGFAAGLGIPIIWTIQSKIADIDNVVHFDVRQYNQIRWTDDHEKNRERLEARLVSTLGRGNRD